MNRRAALAPVVAVLVGLLVAGYTASRRLAVPWFVAGDSMAPALRPGDWVVVDLWTTGVRAPRPGEIVLVRTPRGGVLVKRVSRVAGEIWLEGDNRTDSLDSRQLGAFRPGDVIGRAVWRLWPPSRFGPLR